MNFPTQVQSYFNNHKINQIILADFKVSWNGKSIVYPIFNINGNKIFSIYRRDPSSEIGPKFYYEKGSHVSLYGIHKAKNESTILIVEGLSDCLCSWSQGIPTVTSTGGAQSFQEEWKEFFENKEIFVCLDIDLAGGEGMAKILDLLPGAKLVFLPDRPGIKDISDYVANGGDLHKLIQSARLFKSLAEVIEDRANRIALWQSVHFHDAYIKNHTEPIKDDEGIKLSRQQCDELARAKAYPINQLIKFNRVNKALCPFHDEKNESFHYYIKNNKAYCFGSCGKAYDSVDIYMKLQNCSFLEAVKNLSK